MAGKLVEFTHKASISHAVDRVIYIPDGIDDATIRGALLQLHYDKTGGDEFVELPETWERTDSYVSAVEAEDQVVYQIYPAERYNADTGQFEELLAVGTRIRSIHGEMGDTDEGQDVETGPNVIGVVGSVYYCQEHCYYVEFQNGVGIFLSPEEAANRSNYEILVDEHDEDSGSAERQLYVLTHEHRHGTSIEIAYETAEVTNLSQEELATQYGFDDFEPDREESLTLTPVELPAGLKVAGQEERAPAPREGGDYHWLSTRDLDIILAALRHLEESQAQGVDLSNYEDIIDLEQVSGYEIDKLAMRLNMHEQD